MKSSERIKFFIFQVRATMVSDYAVAWPKPSFVYALSIESYYKKIDSLLE